MCPGLGRALTEDCIRRARRDNAPILALHATPIMAVALPMYLRMGFQLRGEAPPIYGVLAQSSLSRGLRDDRVAANRHPATFTSL